MWRVVVVGLGALGALVASQKAWNKLQEARDGGSQGSLPVQIIVKGATSFQKHIGPWSVRDLTLSVAAMAKVAEKEPPPPPGRPIEELSTNAEFLARAQHWRAVAEAVYSCDRASFSLQTQLPESAIVHVEWNPDPDSLRPAYAVCLDPPHGAVVLAIRGTSHILDMLLNSGVSPEKFRGGCAHAGYAHAAEVLVEEARPHLHKAFAEARKTSEQTQLIVVGHSMGAAVGIIGGFQLKEDYPGMECWGFSTPASLTRELAVESSRFATSILSAYDVVPRFSIVTLERLRQQLRDFDWEHARSLLKGDPEWDNIDKAAQAMGDMQEKVGQGMDGMKKRWQQATGQCDCDGDGHGGADGDVCEKEGLPALYPPGRLLVLAADPPGFGKRPENRSNVPKQRDYGAYPASFEDGLHTKWVLHEAKQEEFLELVVSPWSVSDHMLGNICEGLGFLQRHCPPVLPHQS